MKKSLILSSLLLLLSCSKDQSIEATKAINSINFIHTVDRNSLILGADTCCTEGSLLPYTNANGQKYNVQRLMYLISDIKLHTESETYNIKDIHYVNFEDPSTHIIDFNGLNLDNLNYNAISFTMGLNNDMNLNNNFINNSWHSTMFWPITMGGGYHYMKLEGDFNTDSTTFNTHTGPTMSMDHSFNKYFNFDLQNTRKSNISIIVNMNINNWFTNPNEYVLTNDGIMMNMTSQMQLMDNGSEDVFSISID